MTIDGSTLEYLSGGGMGEVFGFADLYQRLGYQSVSLDTKMAVTLCVLANEGLEARKTRASTAAPAA